MRSANMWCRWPKLDRTIQEEGQSPMIVEPMENLKNSFDGEAALMEVESAQGVIRSVDGGVFS